MPNQNPDRSDPIRVIGEFRTVDGAEQQFLQAANTLAQPAREQDGCLNYLVEQREDDPRQFVVVSSWKNEETLQRHFASPSVAGFAMTINSLVEQAQVSTIDRVH